MTQLRTDGVHCREFAGTGPVILNQGSSSNGCCLFRFHHGPITNVRLSFPKSITTITCNATILYYTVVYYTVVYYSRVYWYAQYQVSGQVKCDTEIIEGIVTKIIHCALSGSSTVILSLSFVRVLQQSRVYDVGDFYMCVCVFSSHSFWTSMDVPAGVTQEEGHTGFLIHLLSVVHALIFLARRIQPFLSLVDREVEFCVHTTRWTFLFLFFSFLGRKIPFAGIELTSQRARGLRGTSELPGRPAHIPVIICTIVIYILSGIFKRFVPKSRICAHFFSRFHSEVMENGPHRMGNIATFMPFMPNQSINQSINQSMNLPPHVSSSLSF